VHAEHVKEVHEMRVTNLKIAFAETVQILQARTDQENQGADAAEESAAAAEQTYQAKVKEFRRKIIAMVDDSSIAAEQYDTDAPGVER